MPVRYTCPVGLGPDRMSLATAGPNVRHAQIEGKHSIPQKQLLKSQKYLLFVDLFLLPSAVLIFLTYPGTDSSKCSGPIHLPVGLDRGRLSLATAGPNVRHTILYLLKTAQVGREYRSRPTMQHVVVNIFSIITQTYKIPLCRL